MTPFARNIATIALNDHVEIPQLGLASFQVPPAETAEVVTHALTAG